MRKIMRAHNRIIQPSLIKRFIEWKDNVESKERKCGGTSLSGDENGQVRWMCGIKLKDRFLSKELRERLGIE